MHTVSVVIPCYNGAKYLRDTLESALAQTHKPLEILVIDDGSTDDSAAIAESFGPPVRVIRQPNQGESVARNRGIDEANGDWIAFIDADDLWLPQKLEKQIASLLPESIGSCTGYYVAPSLDAASCSSVSLPDVNAMGIEDVLLCRAYFHISSLLVSRSASIQFPTWTRIAEDVIYELDLLATGSLSAVQEPLLLYRKHSASQSSSDGYLIGWHSTISRWLNDNCDRVPVNIAQVRSAIDRRLLDACEIYYYQRRWDEFDTLSDYVVKQTGSSRHLRLRRFPKLLYRLVDMARRITSVSVSIQIF